MQKKTAQVIFLPLKYAPSFLQMVHFKELQEQIRQAHAMIEMQERGDKYNIMLRKQSLANRMRDNIKLID